MADIIITTSNPCSNGDHRDVTATIDGVSITERLHNDELNQPMTADERRAFLIGACKVLRRTGTPISSFTGSGRREDSRVRDDVYLHSEIGRVTGSPREAGVQAPHARV